MKIYTYRSAHSRSAKNFKRVLSVALSLLVVLQMTPGAFAVNYVSAAPAGSGAVWTNTGPCGNPQNVNQYQVGQDFYVHVSNFTANTTYNWTFKDPGANGAIHHNGTITTDANGAACINLLTLTANDIGGPYNLVVGDSKNDNFKVDAAAPVDQCPNIDGVQETVPQGMVKDQQGNCVTPPPTDVCPNIDGVQESVPQGMILQDGNCVTPPTDVCPNIDGVQTEVPQGLVLVDGNCVTPPPTDVCPNLDGVQTQVPEGYTQDEQGNCNPPTPTDVCPNIDGNQSSVPEGMIIDNSGNCVNPPVDQCPNIEGTQEIVPEGLVKDEAGNCVTPPPPVDVCVNIEGNQSEVPQGMVRDENGNCTTPETPTDLCLNIPEIQTQVPEGMTRDENGNCNRPSEPTDVCANIDGVQTEVPEGMELQDNNQCVTPNDTTTTTSHRSGGGHTIVTGDSTPQGQVLGATFEPGLPNTGNGPIDTQNNVFQTLFVVLAGLITLAGLNLISFKLLSEEGGRV